MTKTLADNIIEDLDLITWIKARGFYNPVLKVASFGNDACKKVIELKMRGYQII